MKVCVVGGAGYIGSMLVPELLRRKHEVGVIDTFWFGDNLPDHGALGVKAGDAQFITVEDLKGCDAVIFLAGLSNDPMADFDPFWNYKGNAALPAYLAYIAKKAGVKTFIHGGSCSVYGLLEKDARAVEEDRPKTQTPYGVSKLMAEYGVMQQAGGDMRVVSFRMGTVCGWSPRMRFDLVINSMVRDAVGKGIITVNDANAERPILDIRDAVAAYSQALVNSDLSGIYNIFSYNTSIGELAKKVQRRIKERHDKSVVINILGRHDNRSYTVSAHKAIVKGVYSLAKPEHTIDTILDRMGGVKDLEDPRYYNIKTFEKLSQKPELR